MAQYPVPQFIEREKRLIGPLTVRQSIILGVATIILIIIFVASNFFIFFIAAVLIGGSAISLAFIKVNGAPLSNLLFSLAGFFFKPRTYLWKRERTKQSSSLQSRLGNRPAALTGPKLPVQSAAPSTDEISQIAKSLDEQ